MSSSLALTSWPIAALPTGEVQIGSLTLPAHAARDLATRIYEAAGDVPHEVAGRVRCREHLDAEFRGAASVRCWPTGSKHAGASLPALRVGARLTVRTGDTTTAVLFEHGKYWNGFLCQWIDCPIYGPTFNMVAPFVRFSATGVQALLVREKE